MQHSGKGKIMVAVKRSRLPGVVRTGVNRQSTEDIGGSEITLSDTVMADMSLNICLTPQNIKHIHCIRVTPNVNYGLG